MNIQNNKLYFPLFYKYASLFSILSMEEVGELIYSIVILNGGKSQESKPINSKLEAIYKLMLSDAESVFEKNLPKQGAKFEKAPKEQKKRYGDFDYEDAFQKALARSYGDKK